jgi:hypothetical protein
LLWGPSRFEILEVNRSRDVENSEGPYSKTFLYVKQLFIYLFIYFEVANHKIGSFEIRKAQYNPSEFWKIQ